MAQRMPIDPDKGLPDLVKQLTDDSKRLMSDEVRLAKLETAESIRGAGTGAMWLGLAFGIGVVALVAFTLFFATLFGRIANGHYWVGALLVAVIEIAGGLWFLKRGLALLAAAPYSLPDTRAGLKILKG
ncbi:MAG TPA: phage holin family protein [Gemmatimonadaceae bacterium]|nr:phage holin family protein [Gemmatimonadaceae bacterium]